jgi:MFS transporter, PHS family, inorganic phosphate transporter
VSVVQPTYPDKVLTISNKFVDGMELIIIITATFAQALVGVNAVVGVIATYRFIMGAGIGGGHPLSAVTTSKFASRHIRGRLTKAVFTSQGWGIFGATVSSMPENR